MSDVKKFGIVNLLLAVSAVAELGTAVGDVFGDSKVGPSDVVYIPELLAALKDAGKVHYTELIPEASDLDDDERAQLAEAFKAKFRLKNHETVEGVIEQGFEILSYGVQAIQYLSMLWPFVSAAA